MKKISFWTGGGGLFSGTVSLLDAFSIANLCHQNRSGKNSPPIFETEIVTTDGHPVKAHGGIHIQPDKAIHDVKQSDCIVISPFLLDLNPMPDHLDSLKNWLTALRRQGAIVATTCTGTFILAELGLLDGKTATTNWQFANRFRKRYPRVNLKPEYMLVEDDGVISSGAATAVYNLGMHLIKRFGYQRLVRDCARALLVDPNRHSQAPYMITAPLKSHGDAQVLRAQQMMERHYPDIGSIDSVAREVGISSRHFKRRFKKATGDLPVKYIQRVRIDAAKERLETTGDTIDEIAWTVGYKNVSSFCRLFKTYTDLSPSAYRDKFFYLNPA